MLDGEALPGLAPRDAERVLDAPHEEMIRDDDSSTLSESSSASSSKHLSSGDEFMASVGASRSSSDQSSFWMWEFDDYGEVADDDGSFDSLSSGSTKTGPDPPGTDIRGLNGQQMRYHDGGDPSSNVVYVWDEPREPTIDEMHEYETTKNQAVVQRINDALEIYVDYGPGDIMCRWPIFYLFVLKCLCFGHVPLFRFFLQHTLSHYAVTFLLRCRHNLEEDLFDPEKRSTVTVGQGRFTREYENFKPCIAISLANKVGSREIRDIRNETDGTQNKLMRRLLIKYFHRIMRSRVHTDSPLYFDLEEVLGMPVCNSSFTSIVTQLPLLAYGLSSRGMDEVDFLIQCLNSGYASIPREITVDGDGLEAEPAVDDDVGVLDEQETVSSNPEARLVLASQTDVTELDVDEIEEHIFLTHTCDCGGTRFGTQGYICAACWHILAAGRKPNLYAIGVHVAVSGFRDAEKYHETKDVVDRHFFDSHGFHGYWNPFW